MRQIDMDNIVDWIRAEGYYAYVEMTGGGVATIYASPEVGSGMMPMPIEPAPASPYESDNYPRYTVIAGPGTFGYGGEHSISSAGFGFTIGPDDDGRAEPYYATLEDSDLDLAIRIRDILRERRKELAGRATDLQQPQ